MTLAHFVLTHFVRFVSSIDLFEPVAEEVCLLFLLTTLLFTLRPRLNMISEISKRYMNSRYGYVLPGKSGTFAIVLASFCEYRIVTGTGS